MGISESFRRRARPHRRGAEKGGRRGFLAIALEAGLWILLVLTPLALGSVSETATVALEGACFSLLVLGAWRGRGGGLSRVPRSFRIVAGAFVAWSLLQVLPLPPSLLRWVSPGTERLYRENLPGYASGTGSADLTAWLLSRDDTPSRELRPRAGEPIGPGATIPVPPVWKPISWYPQETFRWVIRFLAYWALFLLMVDFLPEGACRRRLPWVLLLLGFGIALEGLLQHFTWNGKIYWILKVYQGSPFGPWVNSNHFSGYLEMIFPLGLGVLLRTGGWTGRRRRRHSRRSEAALAVLVLFTLACILVGLAAARSRGGLFSLLATAALYFMLQLRVGSLRHRHPRLAWAVAAAPLLLLAGGIVAYTASSSFRPVATDVGVEPSFANRVTAWKGAVAMIASNPLSGTGLGTFGLAYPVYKTFGLTSVWTQAHNDYLQVLAESGLVGFTLLLAGMALMVRKCLVPVLGGPWRLQDPVALGAALGVVTLLLHSLVDFNLQIPSNGLLFVVLGGLLVRFREAAAPSPGEDAGSREGAESPEPLD